MANDMSVEQKIDVLTGKIDSLTKDVADIKTDVADIKTDVAVLKTDVAVLKTDVADLKTGVGELQSRVGSLEVGFDQLSTKVSVGFEESHRLFKIGLEGLTGFRETTDARFDTMADDHARQFDLLTKFGVHLRRRVTRVESQASRRR